MSSLSNCYDFISTQVLISLIYHFMTKGCYFNSLDQGRYEEWVWAYNRYIEAYLDDTLLYTEIVHQLYLSTGTYHQPSLHYTNHRPGSYSQFNTIAIRRRKNILQHIWVNGKREAYALTLTLYICLDWTIITAYEHKRTTLMPFTKNITNCQNFKSLITQN